MDAMASRLVGSCAPGGGRRDGGGGRAAMVGRLGGSSPRLISTPRSSSVSWSLTFLAWSWSSFAIS